MAVLKSCENYASERTAVGCIAWLDAVAEIDCCALFLLQKLIFLKKTKG